MKSLPTLPKPENLVKDDVLSSDDDANENDDALLQQCIQSGMRNTTINSAPGNNPTALPASRPNPSARGNPFGLFRNGRSSYLGVDCEVTNRFHTEDSPRTFSVISALSDLTFETQRVGVLETNRMPATKQLGNNSMAKPKVNGAIANIYNSNESISSIDDETGANELLQQCIQAGIRNTRAPTAPKLPMLTIAK